MLLSVARVRQLPPTVVVRTETQEQVWTGEMLRCVLPVQSLPVPGSLFLSRLRRTEMAWHPGPPPASRVRDRYIHCGRRECSCGCRNLALNTYRSHPYYASSFCSWVFWYRQQRGGKVVNYEEGIKKIGPFSSVCVDYNTISSAVLYSTSILRWLTFLTSQSSQ